MFFGKKLFKRQLTAHEQFIAAIYEIKTGTLMSKYWIYWYTIFDTLHRLGAQINQLEGRPLWPNRFIRMRFTMNGQPGEVHYRFGKKKMITSVSDYPVESGDQLEQQICQILA